MGISESGYLLNYLNSMTCKRLVNFLLVFSLTIGCTPREKDATYYTSEAWRRCGKYEQNPKNSTLKKALKYVDKAVEAQEGEYTWALVDVKIVLLLAERKWEEGFSFVEKLDQSNFLYPYQRQMYLNLFKAIEMNETDKDKRKFYIANRELINQTLNENKSNLIHQINSSSNTMGTDYSFIIHDLLINELNLRTDAEIMQLIDSMQTEFGGDLSFYSSLKTNLHKSNSITIRANKRLI